MGGRDLRPLWTLPCDPKTDKTVKKTRQWQFNKTKSQFRFFLKKRKSKNVKAIFIGHLLVLCDLSRELGNLANVCCGTTRYSSEFFILDMEPTREFVRSGKTKRS